MKVGFVCGAFDLLHAGHISMLEQCKKKCDFLIVGLQIDPSIDRPDKHSPVEKLLERQIRLRGCKYVDEVIVYQSDKDLLLVLQYLNVDIRFLGSDYRKKKGEIIEKDLVPISFTRWMPPTSSSLRERIKKA